MRPRLILAAAGLLVAAVLIVTFCGCGPAKPPSPSISAEVEVLVDQMTAVEKCFRRDLSSGSGVRQDTRETWTDFAESANRRPDLYRAAYKHRRAAGQWAPPSVDFDDAWMNFMQAGR